MEKIDNLFFNICLNSIIKKFLFFLHRVSAFAPLCLCAAFVPFSHLKGKLSLRQIKMLGWVWPNLLVLVIGIFMLGCSLLPKPERPAIEKYLAAVSLYDRAKDQSPEKATSEDESLSKAKDESSAGAASASKASLLSPFSLAECIKIALEQNPVNRSAKEAAAAAKEIAGEAVSPYYPELGFSAGYSRWEKYTFLPSGLSRPGMTNIIGPTDDWVTGLRSRFILFDSGERRANLSSAIARQGAAQEDAERMRQEVVLHVHQAYYGLGLSLESRSVASDNLIMAEEHLSLAKERKNAGAVPHVDVIRTESRVAEAKLSLVKAEGLVRVAKGRLNLAMGRSVDTWIEIAAQPKTSLLPEDINVLDAMDQALRARPGLKAALQRVEARRSTFEAATRAFGPKIRAEGGYGWRGPESFPDDEEWSVGISLDLPIFTGFSRKHRLARTKFELWQEEAEVERLILEVQEEVWSAYSNWQQTSEAIRTAEVLVQEAREGLRLIRERYEAGAATMSDLLDTQVSLVQAEAARLETQWDFLLARAQFYFSIGKVYDL